MILYNVTINVEDSVHDDWLHWMKHVHIPDVLATGLFIESRFLRVLSTEKGEGHTYSVQYFLDSMVHYEIYVREHAPRLQQETISRYRDKFVAFRTLLETV